MTSTKRRRFIGCACDRKFVEPTAVMLSSVDANGQTPDAHILVAGFGLTSEDHVILSAGAGRARDNLRVIDITEADLAVVGGRKFTSYYPPAVLGRLFLADQITGPNARLLTLDSDMIINTSLEPLFELDMGKEFFAAIHDPPRDDPNYFNTGMTVTDVDTYKYHDIARRCLRWLAENPDANFPDQDALNAVVGDCWYRLDRTWNWFCSDSTGGWTPEDFDRGRITHFAGPKPWSTPGHAGAGLYQRHLEGLRIKLGRTQTAAPAVVV